MKNEIKIEDHLKLVRLIINKKHAGGKFIMKQCRCEYDDIFQVGCIGLMKAIRDFDESKGFKFTTYASTKISGEIRRYYRDNFSLVRFGRTCNEIANRIKKMDLPAHLITLDFIMKEFKVSKVIACDVIDYMNSTMDSLDTPLEGKSSDMTYYDLFEDKSCAIKDEVDVDKYMSILNEREKAIITGHINELSQIEIGNIVGLSQMQVSRELKRIKAKLKDYREAVMS